jgi:hypothetical protein
LATPAPAHNAANAVAVVMTDVSGSNLVIACCPLDFWRNAAIAPVEKSRRKPPWCDQQ